MVLAASLVVGTLVGLGQTSVSAATGVDLITNIDASVDVVALESALSFTASVENRGRDAATNVVWQIDAGAAATATHIVCAATGGATCPAFTATLNNGAVRCRIGLGWCFVYIDTNRDGVQDATDIPVPGATLTLTGPNGAVIDNAGNPVGPVLTDADGAYGSDGLPILEPGESYTVTIDPTTAPSLAGHLSTQTGQGTTATDSSTGSATSRNNLATNSSRNRIDTDRQQHTVGEIGVDSFGRSRRCEATGRRVCRGWVQFTVGRSSSVQSANAVRIVAGSSVGSSLSSRRSRWAKESAIEVVVTPASSCCAQATISWRW